MESDESILSIGNEYSPKRVSQTLITYIDKVKQIYDFDL